MTRRRHHGGAFKARVAIEAIAGHKTVNEIASAYESHNESRHGRRAHMSHFLTLHRRREKLLEKMKRWTYRGKPTRKARRLDALETRIEAYGQDHLAGLLQGSTSGGNRLVVRFKVFVSICEGAACACCVMSCVHQA